VHAGRLRRRWPHRFSSAPGSGRGPLRDAVCRRICFASLLLLSGLTACTDNAVTSQQRLRQVLNDYRPFVVRFTDGGEHRPCAARTLPEPLCEGALDPRDERETAVLQFGMRTGGRQIDDLHAAAMAELLNAAASGDATEATVKLREAADQAPEDARVAADLAAALLVAGEFGDDLDSVLRAIEKADRALELRSDLVAALFNRALALSWIPLPHQAVAAWDRLLDVEQDEAWRREAMERRSRMLALLARGEEPPVLARCREAAHGFGEPAEVIGDLDGEVQQVRLYVEEELLREWGAAVEAGDGVSAARRLAVASYLVAALESAGGDAVVLRLGLESIQQALRTGSGSLRALARAHRLYGEARVAHDAGEDYEVVGRTFEEAARLLESAGSPFAVWPRFYLAVETHHRPDYPAALDALRRLRRSLPDGDRVVTAYCEWMEGLTRSKQAYLEEALHHFQHADELFAAAGEAENVSAMDSQAALKWEGLGRLDEAWQSHRAALAARQRQYKSRRIQNALSGVAEILERQGRTVPALLFFDEWVAEAQISDNPLSQALAWTGRAKARLALGWRAAAVDDLKRAGAALPGVESYGLRLETRAGVETARAAVYERDDPAAALAALQSVHDVLVASDLRLSLVDVLLMQARLHGRRGSLQEQEAKLTDAIDEVERQRGLIGDDSKRVSYLDQARHVMEEAVAFYLDSGRPEEAFQLSERMRSPVMREEHRRRGIGGELRTLDQLQRELGENTTVLSYLLLGERLVRWEVSRDGLRVQEERDVDRGRLQDDVGRFVASVRDVSIDRGSPLGPRLVPDSLAARQDAQLLIVPDGPLYFLPFAALPVSGGDSLVADHATVVTAPSASVSLDLARRERMLETSEERTALVVANFEHDRQGYPELPSLVSGPEDLKGLRFPGMKTTFLTGPSATRERFLRMFGRFTTVYFGGHGIVRGRYLGGALLLAPDGPDDDGLLSHQDLLGVDGGRLRTQVVILAACNTGVGDLSGTEGPMSAAQPFLAIGVPTVYGSLWPIRQGETMVRDHAILQVYGSPAAL